MNLFRSLFRLLTFCATREEFLAYDKKHFILGLVITWLVGMGRYWDDPQASLLQHLGLGSVIYIFCLAGLIWLLVNPYHLPQWTYMRVLTFVSLTSLPALFYAIPVERIFTMSEAASINVWFLTIVATWRLALLFFFLHRFSQLHFGYTLVVTLLPICLIITALTFLNLERAVFDVMGGIRSDNAKDAAYAVLVGLTLLSALLILPLLVGYFIAVAKRAPFRAQKAEE